MMKEKNENVIREALERIEPAEGARERMLRNIRAKAELENATKNEAKKSRRMLLFKLLPAVAAVVIVVVGALVLKDRLAKKPANTPGEPDNSVVAGGSAETHVISYSKEDFTKDIGELPQLPEEAKEAPYYRDVYGYCVEFAVGGHQYQLYIFRPQGDRMIYVASTYATEVLVEEWEVDEQGQIQSVYRLVNGDGASMEEMETVKAEIR